MLLFTLFYIFVSTKKYINMKNLNKSLKCSGIYYLKNKFNDKLYIGSSKNIRTRIYNHKNKLKYKKHNNPYLQNVINKYGLDCFEVGILEKCCEEDLLLKEQYYLDTIKPEYNLTLKVERNILSKESRLKQSKTRKKRIKSGEIQLVGLKTIYVYNLDGTFFKEFDSIGNACKELNTRRSCVSDALKSKSSYSMGFLWSLTKQEKLKPYNKKIYK